MPIQMVQEKLKNTVTRKAPWLPRVAIVVDIGKYRFAGKYVPLLETLLNLQGGPLTLSRIKLVTKKQFSEIKLPNFTKTFTTIEAFISPKK